MKFKTHKILSTKLDNSDFNKFSTNLAEVSDFIYSKIKDKKCLLFELKPTEHSMIFEYSPNSIVKSKNSKKYLISDKILLSNEDVLNIVNNEDFYLGNLIICQDDLTESQLLDLIYYWDKELFKTELGIFKMDCDGNYFYWYNKMDDI